MIIPGLGGFLATYHPAKIHPVHHRFTPPFREVVFNRSLRQNDGLLALEYRLEAGCEHSEAMRWAEQIGDQLNKQLLAGSPIEFLGVGTLALNDEGKIEFKSSETNALWVEGYGLKAFTARPFLRDKETLKQEHEFHFAPKEKSKSTSSITRWTSWAAAIALVITVGIWTVRFLREPNVTEANIGSISDSIANLNTPITGDINNPQPVNIDSFETTKNVEEQSPDPAPEQVSETVVETFQFAEEKGYQIIIGSLGTLEEAKTQAARLEKAHSLSIQILPKNETGRYRLTLGSYENKADAVVELDKYKPTIFPDAWVFHCK